MHKRAVSSGENRWLQKIKKKKKSLRKKKKRDTHRKWESKRLENESIAMNFQNIFYLFNFYVKSK